jgi:hypothetical protein
MIHLRCSGQLMPLTGVKQAQPTLLPGRLVSLGSTARHASVERVTCAALGSGAGRQSRQIVQFRQQGAGEVEEQELEYLHLDYDCTEVCTFMPGSFGELTSPFLHAAAPLAA